MFHLQYRCIYDALMGKQILEIFLSFESLYALFYEFIDKTDQRKRERRAYEPFAEETQCAALEKQLPLQLKGRSGSIDLVQTPPTLVSVISVRQCPSGLPSVKCAVRKWGIMMISAHCEPWRQSIDHCLPLIFSLLFVHWRPV